MRPTHTRTHTLLSHTNANRYGSSGVTLADAVNSSCACSKRVNGGTKEKGREREKGGEEQRELELHAAHKYTATPPHCAAVRVCV